MELIVEDYSRILKIMDVLTSRAKLRIISILLEKPRISAKEIAELTGTRLPTVLEHLNDLISSGIVEVFEEKRGNRKVKVYSLKASRIILRIDLRMLAKLEEEFYRDLMMYYLRLRNRGIVVKASPSTYELKKLLRVSDEEARRLVAYIRSRINDIVDILVEEALEKIKGSVTVRQIAEILSIDQTLAAMVATKLIEKNFARAEKGKIVLVKESS